MLWLLIWASEFPLYRETSSVELKSSGGISVRFQNPVMFRCVMRHTGQRSQLQPTDAFCAKDSIQSRVPHGCPGFTVGPHRRPHCWNNASRAAAARGGGDGRDPDEVDATGGSVESSLSAKT